MMSHRKPLVQYVYHPHDPEYRVACFVALIRPNGTIGVGWSQCHTGDNFNRKEGLEKATYRALYGNKAVQSPYAKAHGIDPQPTPYRFYNPDGSYEKKDIVGAALDVFRFRAMSWFSPKLAPDCDKTVGDSQLVLFVGSKHDGWTLADILKKEG